jgi:hypothetical protein
MLEVFNDIRSDEEWSDKVTVLEHSDDQLADKPDNDPERAYVAELGMRYHAEIMKRLERLETAYADELDGLAPDELRERYLDDYVAQRGLATFTRVRQQAEVYHCLRVCVATRPPEGQRWDHTRCDHNERYLDSPRDVAEILPDGVVGIVRAAYEGLMVRQDLARFTDGPTTSSESSGPVSRPEDSTLSGPAAPSTTPATISS